MSLPTNRIKKIKASNGTSYDIVPEMLQKSGYSAELPTLTTNSTLVLTKDLDSYLPLSAGSDKPLTGSLYYNGGNRNAIAIRFKDYDANGTGIIIGDGGLVHIGAGESASASNDSTWGYNGGTEALYLTSDGAVYVASNCNTIANRKVIVLDTSGHLRPNASGQALGTISNRWSDLHLSGAMIKGATGEGSCSTDAGTAAKEVTISGISAFSSGAVFVIWISNANTSETALTLNINSLGAKPIYINNVASSTTNYTLSKGWHTFYYNGTNFYTQDYSISGFDASTAMKGGTQIPVANGAWDLGVSAYRWRNLYLTGQMNTSSTTQSTSTTTGSIVTKGGIGVAKNIYCAGTIYEGSTSLASKYVTVNGANMTITNWTRPTRNNTSITDYAGVGYTKYGKLVILHIGDMLCSTQITSTGGDNKLFSGFPKPKQSFTFPCMRMTTSGYSENMDVIRLMLDTSGNLHLHYSTMYANNQYGGDFVYIEA